ncbi:hypothetical protein F5Y16DRAFT_417033 [Xylariaceae sp. FL0255]|nr:hypothetical protein F5Y16DRAFT_417033 [Xylariaceae sp. FL0255]
MGSRQIQPLLEDYSTAVTYYNPTATYYNPTATSFGNTTTTSFSNPTDNSNETTTISSSAVAEHSVDSDSSEIIGIVVVAGAVAVLISLGVFCYCCFKRKRRRSRVQPGYGKLADEETGSPERLTNNQSSYLTPSAPKAHPISEVTEITARIDVSKTLTYRVEGIPDHIDKENLKEYFTEPNKNKIVVQSLERELNWQRSHHSVATVWYDEDSGSKKLELNTRQRAGLHIDVDFFGFTVLYDHATRNSTPGPEVDVIAVTGLSGHAFGSWSESRERLWLRDDLGRSLWSYGVRARIVTYGYDSTVSPKTQSYTTIDEYADTFYSSLKRDILQNSRRPVVFVGHSLGCLLIKLAVEKMLRDPSDYYASRLSLIEFFGAPHRGMDQDALRKLVKGKPAERLIQDLRKNSPTVMRIHNQFELDLINLQHSTGKRLKIVSFYENKESAIVKKSSQTGLPVRTSRTAFMVDPHSAKLGYDELYCDEKSVSIETDHSQIAKLKDSQNCRAYEETVENIVKQVTETAKILSQWSYNISTEVGT